MTRGPSAGPVLPGARCRPASIAAGGLLSLGYLGIFSVGLPLLIGGVLSCAGAVRTWHRVEPGLPARRGAPIVAILAACVPVLGVFVTS